MSFEEIFNHYPSRKFICYETALLPLMSKIISREELEAHKSPESCWVVINGLVIDVTSFLNTHPGGSNTLLRLAGQDATVKFERQVHTQDALKLVNKMAIVL